MLVPLRVRVLGARADRRPLAFIATPQTRRLVEDFVRLASPTPIGVIDELNIR
jgi:hypothetical protein